MHNFQIIIKKSLLYRIVQGSSGSYFCKNIQGDILGVFKPKNEEVTYICIYEGVYKYIYEGIFIYIYIYIYWFLQMCIEKEKACDNTLDNTSCTRSSSLMGSWIQSGQSGFIKHAVRVALGAAAWFQIKLDIYCVCTCVCTYTIACMYIIYIVCVCVAIALPHTISLQFFNPTRVIFPRQELASWTQAFALALYPRQKWVAWLLFPPPHPSSPMHIFRLTFLWISYIFYFIKLIRTFFCNHYAIVLSPSPLLSTPTKL